MADYRASASGAVWLDRPCIGGAPVAATVLCDLTAESGEDAIDGIKVDRRGNLFVCGPGGVWVFSPQGKILGRIETGQRTANCAWGDDGSTLYIAAHMFLLRIRTRTKAAVMPG